MAKQILSTKKLTRGTKINELTFLEKLPKGLGERQNGLFECSCGTIKSINIGLFLCGSTKSCGCIKSQIISKSRSTHGQSGKTPEYSVWCGIKSRCNPASKIYKGSENYSRKGISVCDRWINSFENFMEDMGKRPSSLHSIERKDNDGNYCPENCKWATRREQALNKDTTVYVEIEGKTQNIMAWMKELDVPKATYHRRLKEINDPKATLLAVSAKRAVKSCRNGIKEPLRIQEDHFPPSSQEPLVVDTEIAS